MSRCDNSGRISFHHLDEVDNLIKKNKKKDAAKKLFYAASLLLNFNSPNQNLLHLY